MSLESTSTIDGLVATNPVGNADFIHQGDDHIRMIKDVLKTTFQKANGNSWNTGIDVDEVDVQNGYVPLGGIIMWSGTVATIPTNWQLCNGTNGSPDLRDKFVICARQDDGGAAKTFVTGAYTQTGGTTTDTVNPTGTSGSHSLISAELPTHSHLIAANAAPGGVVTAGTSAVLARQGAGDDSYIMYGSGTTPTLGLTSTVGSGTAHSHSLTLNPVVVDILPPYYALAFIQRVT